MHASGDDWRLATGTTLAANTELRVIVLKPPSPNITPPVKSVLARATPLPRPDLIANAGTDSLNGTQLPSLSPSLLHITQSNHSSVSLWRARARRVRARRRRRGHFFPTRFACGGRSANFMSSFRKLFIRLEILLTCSGRRKRLNANEIN